MARQCQVVRVVSAAVLPGDYVIQVMGKLARFLRRRAILATSAARRRTNSRVKHPSDHMRMGAGSGGPSA